ncbi:MAG: hypothetical protein BWX73_01260 [Lentisphaerae bacterium ADurb.Bin082]|nr:MAG: hypothetical protein BWX73_01260 [Lentisphaerae bacterium ADurb.Bin082]
MACAVDHNIAVVIVNEKGIIHKFNIGTDDIRNIVCQVGIGHSYIITAPGGCCQYAVDDREAAVRVNEQRVDVKCSDVEDIDEVAGDFECVGDDGTGFVAADACVCVEDYVAFFGGVDDAGVFDGGLHLFAVSEG